jgi:hypothetical protein
LTSEKSKIGLVSLLNTFNDSSVPDFIFEDINQAIKEAEKEVTIGSVIKNYF